MQDILTPHGMTVYDSTSVPDLTSYPSADNSSCNSYLPSDSTLDRFNYIVNFLTANDLYVVSPG